VHRQVHPIASYMDYQSIISITGWTYISRCVTAEKRRNLGYNIKPNSSYSHKQCHIFYLL